MNLHINSTYEIAFLAFIASLFLIFVSFKRNYHVEGISALIFFRLLIAILLLVLLLNPSIEIKGTSKKNLPWHIYVDKSLSIKYHRQPSAISYKNGVDNFIKKIKEKNLKI